VIRHTVQQGEHLSGLAEQYGFRGYAAIWDHPANAELKRLRKNPHVLAPGDELTIPDSKAKIVDLATGKSHRIKVRRSKLTLRLLILDGSRQPRANESCTMAVEGASRDIATDGDGKVERPITSSDRRASVEFDDIEVPVDIGALDPVDRPSGWQARLINLGYLESPVDDEDDPDIRSAVEEFQCDYRISITGRFDAATQQKILDAHGV